MGKKAKEHRKKVQQRNARMNSFKEQIKKEIVQLSKEQQIIENYEIIHGRLSEDQKRQILEQGEVRFGT